MKNKGIVYIVVTIILIIIVCFFCLFRYSFNTLDSKLVNKKWYHYDNLTGYYNTFYIDGTKFEYSSPENGSIFSECNKYVFNKIKNELNLNCGKTINIEDVNNNKLTLSIESKKVVFFDSIDDTLNYEFESFYSKSISEYKKEMSRVIDLIKIDSKRLIEILKSGEKSKFIFIGNNCSSVDCTLALDIIEKWISLSENIYYIDINEFTDSELININKVNENFSVDKNFYNDVYPKVITFENDQIIDDYLIKCNGFDCSLYETSKYVGDLK